jgi:hypothetical protein
MLQEGTHDSKSSFNCEQCAKAKKKAKKKGNRANKGKGKEKIENKKKRSVVKIMERGMDNNERDMDKSKRSSLPQVETEVYEALEDVVASVCTLAWSMRSQISEWRVVCSCGVEEDNYDDGTKMYECTSCRTWQHAACVCGDATRGEGTRRVQVNYICAACKKRGHANQHWILRADLPDDVLLTIVILVSRRAPFVQQLTQIYTITN